MRSKNIKGNEKKLGAMYGKTTHIIKPNKSQVKHKGKGTANSEGRIRGTSMIFSEESLGNGSTSKSIVS